MPATDDQRIWRALMDRLGHTPRYRELFDAAYPRTRFERMNLAYATNAIAGYAVLAQRDTLLNGVVIPDSTIDRLTTYMTALTDPRARDLHALVPERVPSGLPVDL